MEVKKIPKNPIGIMQGRLTPSKGRGIQFVPYKEWKEEFVQAKEIGLDSIELNFDLEGYKKHPLWTKAGRETIKKLSEVNRVKTKHLSLDFFMRQPFFRVSEEIRKANIKILNKILRFAHEVGIKNIEIPLLDNSSIHNKKEERTFRESINKSLEIAKKFNITISLETDLETERLLQFIQSFKHSHIKIVYDTGNSASLGFDPKKEIETFGQYISNVHIKDRKKQGPTVPLGTGDTHFDVIFKELENIDYQGDFILQAARGEDTKEAETTTNQIAFIKKFIS